MSEKPVKSKRIKTVQVIKQQDEPIENKPKIKIDTKTLRELDALVNSLNKKFGDNAVTKGVSFTSSKIERIPTGSISLDIALGGGIPKGRYTEISGGLSTSKSTQMLHIIRNAQEMGLICALIDVESTTDEAYIRQIGVDFDSLIYSTPDSTEEAAQLILDLQKSGIVHFAVLDSLAALSPNTEMQKDMDETMRMGITPNLLNEFFRKYQMNNNRLVRENKQPFTLICLNQLREKIGAYGDSEYSPGGKKSV